jgi:hypothetical protein
MFFRHKISGEFCEKCFWIKNMLDKSQYAFEISDDKFEIMLIFQWCSSKEISRRTDQELNYVNDLSLHDLIIWSNSLFQAIQFFEI